MTKYDEAVINWDNPLRIVGYYSVESSGTRVVFNAVLFYKGDSVIYKHWKRQILGYWDPDSMLQTPDPKIAAISEKLAKMGPKTFDIRFKTLKARPDQPSISPDGSDVAQ